MTTFKITLSRYSDRVKITVWKLAESNKQAQELALKDKNVIEFLTGYDGLYDISILNGKSILEGKLLSLHKSQLN